MALKMEYIETVMLGIPMILVTEIMQVVDKHFFIDEQRMGLYSFWHHVHFIEQQKMEFQCATLFPIGPLLAF
jgi:hypothetical protein